MSAFRSVEFWLALSVVGGAATLAAQGPAAVSKDVPAVVRPAQPQATATVPAGVKPPDDYVIGADDVLTVMFWRDKEMSADAIVRPDGKITLPLINEVQAAGLTPDQLRERVLVEAGRFIEDPSPSVIVKTINSRKVFITGEIGKPGPYPLMAPTTIMQLLVVAGGLKDYAHSEKITIMRNENGKPTSYRFNYKEFVKNKNLRQNIELKPGDTVIVP